MAEPVKAFAAFGSDTPRAEVDELLDKLDAVETAAQMRRFREVVDDLSGKPLGNRLALAFLRTQTRASADELNFLRDCRCDGGWMSWGEQLGHGTLRPCERCNPEPYARWRAGPLHLRCSPRPGGSFDCRVCREVTGRTGQTDKQRKDWS
jgi:hypothetical protein